MSIWNMLSEVMDSNPERYTTQYKNRKGDSWNTAYSGSSEDTAMAEAERRGESCFAVRVLNNEGSVIYTC